MHDLIQEYDKPFMQELFDFIFIQKHIDNSQFRDFLIKYKIIKPSTRQIYAHHYRYNFMHIYAKNGKGTVVFEVVIDDEELPILIKQLS